tara:strand:+ start:60 stop:536 length:477 start_codon:yes stop_codon:yes gene_type:complete
MYGQNKDGKFLGNRAAGRVILTDGATSFSLSEADAGSIIVISGGVAGACAISLPEGKDGMTFEFWLKAANGTGDCDIDAKDVSGGVHDYFLGMITHHEADADTNTPFAAATNDQLTLAASKGDVGDYMKIVFANGHWLLTGHTGDADGWVVGTASANN